MIYIIPLILKAGENCKIYVFPHILKVEENKNNLYLPSDTENGRKLQNLCISPLILKVGKMNNISSL